MVRLCLIQLLTYALSLKYTKLIDIASNCTICKSKLYGNIMCPLKVWYTSHFNLENSVFLLSMWPFQFPFFTALFSPCQIILLFLLKGFHCEIPHSLLFGSFIPFYNKESNCQAISLCSSILTAWIYSFCSAFTGFSPHSTPFMLCYIMSW